jgi:PAS domain S-box-containing protein
VLEFDEALIARVSGDASDVCRMRELRVAWWVIVPLRAGETVVGMVGLGLGADRGRPGHQALEFYAGVAQRLGAALASTRLVTDLQRTRRRLERILHALAEAVTVHDEAGQMVYANDAAARLLGAASVEEVLAARAGELAARFIITKEDGSPVGLEDLPGRRLLDGEEAPALLTRSVHRATGRVHWLLTKATLLDDKAEGPLAVNIIEDVTEARTADQRQRFLADAGALLATSLDYGETLERVAQLAVPALADWCGVDVVDEAGRLRRVGLAHRDPAKLALGHEFSRRYPPRTEGDSGMAAVLRRGTAELYPEVPDEMLVAGALDEEHLRMMRELGMRSVMLLPMTIAGRTIGVLTLVHAESGRRFGEEDLGFALEVARRAAVAVENARLYTERTEASRTLQRSLLPERLPPLAGWTVAASYHAGLRGSEVGGDFYDVVPRGGHEGFWVVFGDVTGKGVKAAALTALARHTMRTAALYERGPAAVLAVLDRVLRDQASPSVVAAVCALVEPTDTGARVTVAAGGHPLPLRLSAGGVSPVGHHDILLGALPGREWREATADLAAGDVLLFYSDGVTDTPGTEERFGDRRLHDLLAGAPRAPAELVERLDTAVEAFEAGPLADDRALLALRLDAVGSDPAPGAPDEPAPPR